MNAELTRNKIDELIKLEKERPMIDSEDWIKMLYYLHVVVTKCEVSAPNKVDSCKRAVVCICEYQDELFAYMDKEKWKLCEYICDAFTDELPPEERDFFFESIGA